MYCTTPSGTRYQTGIPRPTRSRQSLELIASAGTSTRLTAPSGRWDAPRSKPGRVPPQVGERVDRVGGAAAVDVHPAHREPRVGGGGDDGHEVPVLGGRDVAV